MTAAFIDDLRSAFGREAIDAMIRRGVRGQADFFYAEECGHRIGTPFDLGPGIAVSAMQVERGDPVVAGGRT